MSQTNARLLFVAVLGFTAVYMLDAFIPALVWAGIFGIALRPQYRRLEIRFRTGGHNILLPLLSTLGVALVFMIPLVIIGMQLSHEARTVFSMIMNAREHGISEPAVVSSLPLVGSSVSTWWQENLASPESAAALLRGYARNSMEFSREAGHQVLHRATQFAFTLVALFFLFRDGDALSAQVHAAAAKLFGAHGKRILDMIVSSIHGTVNGLVLVGIGEGILMGIVYAIAGVPHSAMLGMLTAVAAMIPFAAPLVFAVAALLLTVQGGIFAAIAVFAIGMAVTFVADHFVRPGLIGGSTQLPFLWVLLGILGGVESFGLLGLFVGPALMAVLTMLWREWIAPSVIVDETVPS